MLPFLSLVCGNLTGTSQNICSGIIILGMDHLRISSHRSSRPPVMDHTLRVLPSRLASIPSVFGLLPPVFRLLSSALELFFFVPEKSTLYSRGAHFSARETSPGTAQAGQSEVEWSGQIPHFPLPQLSTSDVRYPPPTDNCQPTTALPPSFHFPLSTFLPSPVPGPRSSWEELNWI